MSRMEMAYNLKTFGERFQVLAFWKNYYGLHSLQKFTWYLVLVSGRRHFIITVTKFDEMQAKSLWKHLRDKYQLPVGLIAQLVRALHRYCRGHGFVSRSSLNFFRFLLFNCLSWNTFAAMIFIQFYLYPQFKYMIISCIQILSPSTG